MQETDKRTEETNSSQLHGRYLLLFLLSSQVYMGTG